MGEKFVLVGAGVAIVGFYSPMPSAEYIFWLGVLLMVCGTIKISVATDN